MIEIVEVVENYDLEIQYSTTGHIASGLVECRYTSLLSSTIFSIVSCDKVPQSFRDKATLVVLVFVLSLSLQATKVYAYTLAYM